MTSIYADINFLSLAMSRNGVQLRKLIHLLGEKYNYARLIFSCTKFNYSNFRADSESHYNNHVHFDKFKSPHRSSPEWRNDRRDDR